MDRKIRIHRNKEQPLKLPEIYRQGYRDGLAYAEKQAEAKRKKGVLNIDYPPSSSSSPSANAAWRRGWNEGILYGRSQGCDLDPTEKIVAGGSLLFALAIPAYLVAYYVFNAPIKHIAVLASLLGALVTTRNLLEMKRASRLKRDAVNQDGISYASIDLMQQMTSTSEVRRSPMERL